MEIKPEEERHRCWHLFSRACLLQQCPTNFQHRCCLRTVKAFYPLRTRVNKTTHHLSDDEVTRTTPQFPSPAAWDRAPPMPTCSCSALVTASPEASRRAITYQIVVYKTPHHPLQSNALTSRRNFFTLKSDPSHNSPHHEAYRNRMAHHQRVNTSLSYRNFIHFRPQITSLP